MAGDATRRRGGRNHRLGRTRHANRNGSKRHTIRRANGHQGKGK